MSIAIESDHLALADTVRRWCVERLGDPERRDGYDEPSEAKPPYWAEVVEMGWTTLAVPESHGGQGYGLEELGIVLEETGRASLGGPLLPTALSAVLLAACADTQTLLTRIAEGAAAAVAFASKAVIIEGAMLSGEWDAVLGARWADLLIVPILGDKPRWAVLGSADVTIEDATSIDRSRPVSTVRVKAVSPLAVLSADDVDVAALAGLLLSAEAVGVAQWCVDTAAEYAADRVQFGRPIGQFQGVKHRCADMLAVTELARAAVWDACRGGADDEASFAIDAATSLAPSTALRVAKDCIQVLGGIGFTWEHDAHLYLRRALASVSLLEDSSIWRARSLNAIESGTRRVQPVRLPARADEIRAEVQAWLSALADVPRDEWNRQIADSGYLAPHWPKPWGLGADPVTQIVIDQEFSAAHIRRPHLQVAAWALPTLVAHGTEEQQRRWMAPSMRQELMWCQLFSEPEAGSDLAALRMRALRDDGGWVLTGQKVWTSMAEHAQWGICLARTNPDAPNHEGITCFFVDMASEGIEIRPLRELTGDAWFNEVFFDDVFVPDDCVIGEVDDGWRAGRTTLANERVAMGSGASIGSDIDSLVTLLAEHDAVGIHRDSVAALVVEEHALWALRTRMTLRALDGADAGPEASIVKLLGVIHDQNLQEVGLEVLGPLAATADGAASSWVNSFLWNRCLTIAGGTSEIQRNVIGERLLGLPKDN